MIKVVKTIFRELNRETAKFLNKQLLEILTGMLVKSSDTGKLNLSVHGMPVSSKFIESFCLLFPARDLSSRGCSSGQRYGPV